jgi:hypothetical protein
MRYFSGFLMYLLFWLDGRVILRWDIGRDGVNWNKMAQD